MHGYDSGLSEGNGILYTCKGGHIDTEHVRLTADWTRYLTIQCRKALTEGQVDFSFALQMHSSTFAVHIAYPGHWQSMQPALRRQAIREASVQMGQYLAFTAVSWHEVLTWFGFKAIGVYPQFQSAFSWEDSYSNLIGARLAGNILNGRAADYEKAMTAAIVKELDRLDVQPADTARQSTETVRGTWFSGFLPSSMKVYKRNIDLGVDDGHLTPSLIPDVSTCEGAYAQPYPVPTLDGLGEYGLKVRVHIRIDEWEKGQILKIAYPEDADRRPYIDPAIHLRPIMEHIKLDATVNRGFDCDS